MARPLLRRGMRALGRPRPRDAIAGLVTGLFSLPEGMAYAAIAGFPPASGIYAGVVPTVVGSLLSRTVLMITTLTSAIALSSQSVLREAGLDPGNTGHVAALALMVGVVMLVFGLLRAGSIMNFVSNAVMTGFTTGIAVQIVTGVLGDATGYKPENHNTLARLVDWLAHAGDWQLPATLATLATIAIYAVLWLVEKLRPAATLIALLAMSFGVSLLHLDVETVASIGAVPSSLPPFTLPDLGAVPHLALGSFAVAAVALAQAAGIGSAVPNPDGSRPSVSGDFVAQGAANVTGAFFGALPVGGSLSRTGVARHSGAATRWAGIFAGLWLALALLVAGSLAGFIPMPVIGGLVIVIGIELILGRWNDIVLVFKTAPGSAAAMVLTFLATTQLPLQQAIAIGALTSIVLYAAAVVRRLRVRRLVPSPEGGWETRPLPTSLRSHTVTVLYYGGITLFAAVARLSEEWPDSKDAHRAAIVLDLGTVADVPSTVLIKALRNKAERMQLEGNRLILSSVDEAGERYLRAAGVLDLLGEENVYLETPQLFGALKHAYRDAKAWAEADDDLACADDGARADR